MLHFQLQSSRNHQAHLFLNYDTLSGETSKIDNKFYVLEMSSFRLRSTREVERHVTLFVLQRRRRRRRRAGLSAEWRNVSGRFPAQESRVLSPDDD